MNSVKVGEGQIELQEKEQPRQPYWQGQQSIPTYISAHKPNNNINEEEYDETDDTKYNRGDNRNREQVRRHKRNNRKHRRVN